MPDINKQNIITYGIFDKLETRKDRTLKCTFLTQELTPEHSTALMQLVHEYGFIAFSPREIKKEELLSVPEIEMEFPNEKSPSQRLRNTLYVLWEQSGSKGNFDTYYKQKMEMLITVIKDKLN